MPENLPLFAWLLLLALIPLPVQAEEQPNLRFETRRVEHDRSQHQP